MPAERQPEGPVEEADRVRRRACAMYHIALRAAPALIGFLNRRRHILSEKCGLGPSQRVADSLHIARKACALQRFGDREQKARPEGRRAHDDQRAAQFFGVGDETGPHETVVKRPPGPGRYAEAPAPCQMLADRADPCIHEIVAQCRGRLGQLSYGNHRRFG